MNRRTLLRRIGSAGTVGLLGTLAGCTGSGSGDGGGGDNAATTTSGGGTAIPTDGEPMTATTTAGGGMMTTTGGGNMTFNATVNVFSDDKYSDILVGPNGLSLYILTADKKGKSTCYERCANIWPPFTRQNSTKSDAVTAPIGTITRRDGAMQVTVGGRHYTTSNLIRNRDKQRVKASSRSGACGISSHPTGHRSREQVKHRHRRRTLRPRPPRTVGAVAGAASTDKHGVSARRAVSTYT
jgi:predicted lipoprotein with Yx(FWY)xxD motif